ncbi:MAG: hypothetical protein IJP21_03710 [Clostridia bacterium]|nr:hypothetical protein [Clostridia bacterium]
MILSVLCVLVSCKKNKDIDNNSDVSSTVSKIEYVDEVESLTSEEYEELVSWWDEVTSNSSVTVTITPVTSTNEGTESTPESSSQAATSSENSSSSEVSSTTTSSESDVSDTSKPGFIPGAY